MRGRLQKLFLDWHDVGQFVEALDFKVEFEIAFPRRLEPAIFSGISCTG